jgi:Uma2 family endonuclease
MSAVQEVSARPVTAEEMLARAGQGMWELVRGEVRELMPPGGKHGSYTQKISVRLTNYVWDHRLGEVFAAETGFLLARDPDTVRGADVSFVAASRLPDPLPDGWIPTIPDLVVEVVSTWDTKKGVREKAQDWLDAGVRLLWIVYPNARTVHVYRPGGEVRVLSEDDVLDGEEVVPGFSLPVGEIFA